MLFTSQSYVRQSQPAISPSFAAGLSAAPEEEPNTTPSQDSRVSGVEWFLVGGSICSFASWSVVTTMHWLCRQLLNQQLS